MAENGLIPDYLVKLGIRKLCRERLTWAKDLGDRGIKANKRYWVEKLKVSPIALLPEKANEQHYEVPPKFFEIVLGENLKYSSGYWEHESVSLDKSELDLSLIHI